MTQMTLKAARVNAGLSVKEAAQLADVTEDTMYRYESGKSSPKIGTALKLATAYGVPVSAIDFGCSDKTD